MCADIKPVAAATRFLILQHPQERKRALSTARIASLSLPGAIHKVGLSWRSLTAALGEPGVPKEWAVLFLGALKDAKQHSDAPFQIVSKGGEESVPFSSIKGIVLLDGNWKQSKTLWWRNPWLLKLHRVILNPEAPSLYGGMRKEPRRECLSTIEAAAEAIAAIEKNTVAADELRGLFRKQLEKLGGSASASSPS